MATVHTPSSSGMTPAEVKAEALRIDNFKFGMWLYLASEVVIFTVFIGAYAIMRLNEGEVVKAVHDQVDVLLVTLNTFLLLTSSWAMVMGLREIQRNNVRGLINWLSLTAVLGVIFMFLQYEEYRHLSHLGITLGFDANQWQTFGMHFYVPTFFHGIHVLIGVIWCVLLILNARHGGYSARRHLSIEVFGLYWHFVDVVWIILFTLIYLV